MESELESKRESKLESKRESKLESKPESKLESKEESKLSAEEGCMGGVVEDIGYWNCCVLYRAKGEKERGIEWHM